MLVCDVGGGTTDFSLIAVSEEGGELRLERVAVGEHILLGGDNMDLALARVLQARLEEQGHKIDTWQLHGLWHQARLAKEALFGDPSLASHPVTLLGRGSKLIGGSIRTEVTADDLRAVLLDGFLPRVASDAMPARQRRVGLPGARPAVRGRRGNHQAACEIPAATGGCCRDIGRATRPRRPRVSDARALQRRRDEGRRAARAHRGCVERVDRAKKGSRRSAPSTCWMRPTSITRSHGAPPTTGVRALGRGVRIRSGAARSYYIGIESAMPAVPGMAAPLKALCVVPFGMEEGTSAAIDREFGLIVGEPAEFRFLSSGTRKSDAPGTLVDDWGDEIDELSPLEVTLSLDGRDDTVLPVTLESRVTEVGTLELWCVSRDEGHRWKLELNIREHER